MATKQIPTASKNGSSGSEILGTEGLQGLIPTASPPKAGQIFDAMANVGAEIGVIRKGQKNAHFQFNFRGVDDAYNHIHPIFAKHGVFCAPKVLKHEIHGKKSVVIVEYRFYTRDGSSVETVGIGEANDNQDKGMNKCLSAAHKYILFQMFHIPTDEIDIKNDDPDFKSGVVESEDAPEGVETPVKVDPEKPISDLTDDERKSLGLISKKQLGLLKGRVEREFIPKNVAKDIISKYGYTESNRIKWKDFNKILKDLDNYKEPSS